MPKQSQTAQDKLRNAIQLVGFHYIVCMKSVPTNDDHRLVIGSKAYVFASIGATNNRQLHNEFQRWAGVVALRDMIETFSIFLAEVYQHAIQANQQTKYSATPSQYERMGIEDQLNILTKNFVVDAKWIAMLIGYNRARNCLAHRLGIVGIRDATDGNELVLHWLTTPNATLISGTENPFVDGAKGPLGSLIGFRHGSGSAVECEIQEKEKRFAIGSSMSFHPEDILEICQTMYLAASAFSTLENR